MDELGRGEGEAGAALGAGARGLTGLAGGHGYPGTLASGQLID